jgi:ATP-binding cassette, subfamily B, bacterial PglK
MFKQFLKSINVIGQKNRLNFFYLIFLQIIIVILELFSLTLIIPGITILLDSSNLHVLNDIPFFNNYILDNIILSFLLLFVVLTLTKISSLVYAELKSQKYLKELSVDLSKKIYSYFVFLPWKEIIKKDHADIIRNILSDTELFINQGLARYIFIFKNLFLLLMFVAYLLFVNVISTLIILFLFVLFTLIFVSFFKTRSVNMSLKLKDYQGYRYRNVADSLMSLRELKLINNQNFFLKNFVYNEKKLADIKIIVNLLSRGPKWLLEILIVTSTALIIFYFSKYNLDLIKLIPTIGLYLYVVFRLIPLFIGFNNDILAVRYSKFQIDEVIKNISQINDNKEENIQEDKIKKEKVFFDKNLENNIEIKNVSFSYDKDSPIILDDINIALKKNFLIGIEGENGSGKSTLVDLVSGLLKPNNGEILFNKKDINKSLNNWQKNIGYVSQSVFLSNNSIRDNILFGRQNIDQDKLDKVIKITELNQLLDKLPSGIDTKIGSLGNFISGGQKQKIAIARALLDDPSIIILDEATNALDNAAEVNFFDIINKIKKDRITIIISHSQEVQELCDIRYLIKDKKINLI